MRFVIRPSASLAATLLRVLASLLVALLVTTTMIGLPGLVHARLDENVLQQDANVPHHKVDPPSPPYALLTPDDCDNPVISSGSCLLDRTVNVTPPNCMGSPFLPYYRYKFEVYSCASGNCTPAVTDTLEIELYYGTPGAGGTLVTTLQANPVPTTRDKYLVEFCYTGSTPPDWFNFSFPDTNCGTEWVKIQICCTQSCSN